MQCEDVRNVLADLDKGAWPPEVHEHLLVCADCRAEAEDWRELRAGFRVLQQEAVPEATVGFTERLLRQLPLQDGGREAALSFWEVAGRRFVYASMLLVMAILVAMLLPSSGPLRPSASVDTYLPRTEMVASQNYPIEIGDTPETVDFQQNQPAKAGQK